jgi:hypothetical protein
MNYILGFCKTKNHIRMSIINRKEDSAFESTTKSKICKHRLGLTILLIFFFTATFHAQEMAAPIPLQLALFFKILPFDRNLKSRVGDEIVMGIVYQKKSRTSLNSKEEMVKVMNNFSVKEVEDIPIRQVLIDIDDVDLASAISNNKIDVLYITPLSAVGIKEITEISRANKITTLTGVPVYVESGLAVGIGTKDEKPQIIINLPAAKAEGADFSSQLLKLVKVIKG